ncbi:MAG: hypothetical protein AB8U25_03300 [Rickettsiales endosymbiont of Dermacentor nuttalli]
MNRFYRHTSTTYGSSPSHFSQGIYVTIANNPVQLNEGISGLMNVIGNICMLENTRKSGYVKMIV